MLSDLKSGLLRAIESLFSSRAGLEEAIKTFIKDLQRALLLSDVGVEQVYRLTRAIEESLSKDKIPPGLSQKEYVIQLLYQQLIELLGGTGSPELRLNTQGFNVILLVGLEGSGKTTTAAKLARWLQKRGYRVGLICADMHRAGAYEQLKTLVMPVDIPVYWEPASDPFRLVHAGLEYFRRSGMNVVIIDTAGRHKDERSLMEEIKQLSHEVRPTYTILVIDAAMGQQSAAQAASFNEAVGINGIVITKLDGTAKGGGAISAVAATGARIYFICAGDRIDDIEPFDAQKFVNRLLGLGDIESLLVRVKEAGIETDEEAYAKKLLSGKFTLNDLLKEMQRLSKLGPLRKVLELLPLGAIGITELPVEQLESKLKIWNSIINSMTAEERDNPELIDSKRIKRIANGSGREEKSVKELLEHYKKTKQLIKLNRGKLMKMLGQRRLP
jgi:signal recognition particle subunit SRP54